MEIEVIQTDDGIFYDDGTEMIEVPCQYFAKCVKHAKTTMSHPILGDLPVCADCKAFYERLA